MSKGIKGLFEKIAGRIYVAGKAKYEEGMISSLFNKGSIDPSVHFTVSADLQNLSGNKDAIRIGTHSNIEGLIMVYPYGGEVSIGTYCSLSPGSRLIAVNRISIGDRVLIAHNVNIIDNNSHPLDAALRHQDYKESYTKGMQQHDLHAAPIIIEDDVWIGHNTTVMKGVRIGQGAVIGSGSVVTKDIEPWSVNVGNPLRVIKYLNKKDQ